MKPVIDVFHGISIDINNLKQKGPGYYSDLEISPKKRRETRAASVPINHKEMNNLYSKFTNKVNPKLKANFCSGNICKWCEVSGQKLRKEQHNSDLVANGPSKEVGNVMRKATIFNVYTRNFSRKLGGGKKIVDEAQPFQKNQEPVMRVSERSDGEIGIKESFSFDDDNSSEDFIITSDIDVQAEKEKHEEAAYEGIRCLLGEGSKEFEGVEGIEVEQFLNQSKHSGSSVQQSCGEGGIFLSDLNFKLITTGMENPRDNRDAGPSCSKRSGVRELRNLVSNVNYEKGLNGKGKNRLQ